MRKYLQQFGFLLLFFLITNAIQAQTVTLDGSTFNRPIAITGLVVNGTTYNVTIRYTQTIDGTTLTVGLPISDALAAANAIKPLLEAQAGSSTTTSVCIVTEDDGFMFKGVCLNADNTGPTWNLANHLSGSFDFGTNPGNGIAFFCPEFTGITPALPTVINSTCTTAGGTPAGGKLTAPTTTNCPTGSTLQYATDGTTFSTTLPTYNQTTAQTITTKCVCNGDNTMASGTDKITTVPGTCPCPSFTNITPALPAIANSTCTTVGGTPAGGKLTAPTTTNCPTGSTLQYATDGTTFSTTLPTYNQTTAQTITTKCVCDVNNTMASGTAEVTTIPGVCPASINYGSGNRLTFGDPCKCEDSRNCNINNTFYFHDTLTIPATGTLASGLDIRVNNSSDFYIAVPCFGGALTAPTNGVLGTRILETSVGSGVYKIEFWRPSGAQPTMSVIESGLVTSAPASIFQPICTVEACVPIPTMSQWGLVIFGLVVLNLGLWTVKRLEFV